ncbi:hypothetical protein [Blastococcus sp. PRF04-17]|uniref:hypothetical protein n=1 Tax=Blastococcus sp. PRF04-17 TaxID=2933797 RepID=UPI001FF0FADF|nr:hypothetical protein [Blastococcus sp. PRF04-17]UOY02361.1 hypothetical protein MVA48_02960 [Blastococcus sp. PRF04-17]
MLPLNLGIRAMPPPVEVGQLVEAMWWHPAFDDDPEHAYRATSSSGRRNSPGEAPSSHNCES